jgi:DNA replication protein DnaC
MPFLMVCLAIAIGYTACLAGKSVLFATVVDAINMGIPMC